jgi:hypothetical protein
MSELDRPHFLKILFECGATFHFPEQYTKARLTLKYDGVVVNPIQINQHITKRNYLIFDWNDVI